MLWYIFPALCFPVYSFLQGFAIPASHAETAVCAAVSSLCFGIVWEQDPGSPRNSWEPSEKLEGACLLSGKDEIRGAMRVWAQGCSSNFSWAWSDALDPQHLEPLLCSCWSRTVLRRRLYKSQAQSTAPKGSQQHSSLCISYTESL